jgi:hypothetical protein
MGINSAAHRAALASVVELRNVTLGGGRYPMRRSNWADDYFAGERCSENPFHAN